MPPPALLRQGGKTTAVLRPLQEAVGPGAGFRYRFRNLRKR
ncbi:hypothetical protein NK6_9486 [Bradyrhizobium diazoefficiens]|uniref:Uncharacterized protein n=1 Tax=Bradyrhizobium diazoefficiens TaxID=1355477 RepID=A0A0E3VXG6_9BRAD|nr:hypothetical protein NK6_9486 [Bradyrhizobium diazoefficiens]